MTIEFTTQTVADGIWHIRDARGGVMYLVAGTERALLIDTGFGEGDLLAHIATLTDLPVIVVNTHFHGDHTLGNKHFPKVYIHTEDAPLVQEPSAKLIPIYDGYVFDLGGRELRVITVPGHTPGSVCLRLDGCALVGDAIFPGGPGHTLSPDALAQSLQSLERTVFTWSDDTELFPGHGGHTTVGAERAAFMRFVAAELPSDLYGDVTWR